MQSSESLKRILCPFYLSQKYLPAPPRSNFSVHRSGGFLKNLKILVQRWSNGQEREAEKAYNRGFKAHVIGKLSEAKKHYEACLQGDPNHFATLINLAGLCAHESDFNQARDYLEQALFGTRGIKTTYYNLGLLFQAMNQPEQAIEAFQKALEYHPTHFWSLVNLAELLVDRVQIEDAISYYNRSLESSPDKWLVNIRLVELNYLEGNYSEAERILRKSIDQRETPETLYNLGWLLLIQNKAHHEAVELFKKARLKKAPYFEALFNQALAESMNGDFEDSLAHMQSYTRSTTPDDMSLMVKNFRTLTRVNGQNVPAVMKIATQLFESGYDEEAVSELILFLKRKPDHIDALKLLSQYEFETGNTEMALETCHRILALAQDDQQTLDTYILLSRIYGAREDYDLAMEFIGQALKLNPGMPDLNYKYGTFLAQNGDFQNALKHYKRVSSTAPNFPRIQSRIRMVEEELRELRQP